MKLLYPTITILTAKALAKPNKENLGFQAYDDFDSIFNQFMNIQDVPSADQERAAAASAVVAEVNEPTSMPAGFAAFRADEEGADAISLMVRANICRIFHGSKTLKKCPVKNIHLRNMLRNYACNCFSENFDEEPSTANGVHNSWNMGKNGKPIDEIDAACNRLRDRYTCITFDVENEVLAHPDVASPDLQDQCGRSTNYELHINNEKEIVCGPESDPEYASLPDDNCRKTVCNIERQFADEVAEHIGADPTQYMNDNQDKYFLFLDAEQCVSGNNGQAVSECCGNYPLRTPFIPFIKTCCDLGNGDFEVKYIGDC